MLISNSINQLSADNGAIDQCVNYEGDSAVAAKFVFGALLFLGLIVYKFGLMADFRLYPLIVNRIMTWDQLKGLTVVKKNNLKNPQIYNLISNGFLPIEVFIDLNDYEMTLLKVPGICSLIGKRLMIIQDLRNLPVHQQKLICIPYIKQQLEEGQLQLDAIKQINEAEIFDFICKKAKDLCLKTFWDFLAQKPDNEIRQVIGGPLVKCPINEKTYNTRAGLYRIINRVYKFLVTAIKGALKNNFHMALIRFNEFEKKIMVWFDDYIKNLGHITAFDQPDYPIQKLIMLRRKILDIKYNDNS